MLVVNQKGKSMDISLNPQFLTDLGMLVQIVFPKPTQSFMAKNEIICVLESNRKLISLRNPFEGVFRAFNGHCESLPEKYTADQVLFSVQPMTIDEYMKEKAEKEAAKAAKATKKAPPALNLTDPTADAVIAPAFGQPLLRTADGWARMERERENYDRIRARQDNMARDNGDPLRFVFNPEYNIIPRGPIENP